MATLVKKKKKIISKLSHFEFRGIKKDFFYFEVLRFGFIFWCVWFSPSAVLFHLNIKKKIIRKKQRKTFVKFSIPVSFYKMTNTTRFVFQELQAAKKKPEQVKNI